MASRREKILERVGNCKIEISEFLDQFLIDWEKQEEQDRWRRDVRERLQEMVKEGKMVRGSLVMITNELYEGEDSEAAIKTAAAIELLHTGILMHDDIIDKDDRRRGLQTFQKQYRELAKDEGIDQTQHFGMSMGLAGGDVSFFLGQQLISTLNVSEDKKREINELVFTEFSNVGLAEQIDIYAGFSDDELDEKEIIRLYRDKTARYTFSLPLKAGAALADISEDEKQRLYELGEKIGIIFQLKDDELGLFGERDKTGEEIGSDLDENKKTLHRLKLLERLPKKKESDVREMLGTEMSSDEREYITNLMQEYDVKSDVREKMEEMCEEASEEIKELRLGKKEKEFLKDVAKFCLEREK